MEKTKAGIKEKKEQAICFRCGEVIEDAVCSDEDGNKFCLCCYYDLLYKFGC